MICSHAHSASLSLIFLASFRFKISPSMLSKNLRMSSFTKYLHSRSSRNQWLTLRITCFIPLPGTLPQQSGCIPRVNAPIHPCISIWATVWSSSVGIYKSLHLPLLDALLRQNCRLCFGGACFHVLFLSFSQIGFTYSRAFSGSILCHLFGSSDSRHSTSAFPRLKRVPSTTAITPLSSVVILGHMLPILFILCLSSCRSCQLLGVYSTDYFGSHRTKEKRMPALKDGFSDI